MEGESSPNKSKAFQVKRALLILFLGLTDMLCFFHRSCPSVTCDQMAQTYGVDVGDLSIFSSMYFYSFTVLVPFTGIIADVMEPTILIFGATLVAASGSVICGFSKTLAVGCLGRILVGLGCATVYAPCVRVIANWFPLKYYPTFAGIFGALAAVGGLAGQGPMVALSKAAGWQWCYFAVAITGGVFALFGFIFVRGHPRSCGYGPVNVENEASAKLSGKEKVTIKERLTLLWANVKVVVKNKNFWLVGGWTFFANGSFYNVNGMWGGPFLQDVLAYEPQTAGNALMAISVGLIAGPLIWPALSNCIRTRKWVIFFGTLVSVVPHIVFMVCPTKLNFWIVVLMLFVFSVCTNALYGCAFPLAREYFHSGVAATAVGLANWFGFLSSAIYQPATGKLIAKYKVPGTTRYTEEGYTYTLWLFSAISVLLAALCILFAQDTDFEALENQGRDGYQNIDDEQQSLMSQMTEQLKD